ncbi:uncharacterized protein ACLA_043870 [Aspergillus clavatus NRRL 1]|uniref:Uncharacterized protein n=1 Tax=Aspergillus clavatus (strain ATCC 1007 / CBS 513.65 / DSM 816 / NCTC 3887 / NRRL 1 / QM 1276 / 107) TaxID=344612 RepID=A1C8N0_ASPCL|nr:uncharacterized protein ACLA_043870 [Aspergillus clavatus NRRL 1]EAW13667.1 hypothetical protein ACLA_043870 [Aspergillus clavatus NRRL 1]
MHFFSSLAALATAGMLVNANPLQIHIDVPNDTPLQKDIQSDLNAASSPTHSVRPTDDDKLDIEFGKCYRIKDHNDEKLGLYSIYYKFGGEDGNRVFRVCRETGACKNENRNDQQVRTQEHFYLKDADGSSISNGPAWMASAGSLLYPLPNGYPNLYIAKLWGYPVCEDDDEDKDGEDCEICVSQREAYNKWNGLSTQANTKYITTSPNERQCVYLKFKKVRCPPHLMSED